VATLTGVWGGAPSGAQGQSPWWGQGALPPEAESLFKNVSKSVLKFFNVK